MDLHQVKTRGMSQSARGSILNPLRTLLWHLTLGFHTGVLDQVDIVKSQQSRNDAEFAALRHDLKAIQQQIAHSIRNDQFAPIRKDLAAIGHRLVGIEEELPRRDVTAVTEALRASVSDLSNRLSNLESRTGALAERVNPAGRTIMLRAGESVTLGHDNLVLATTPPGRHMLVRSQDLIGTRIVEGHEWEPHVRAAIEQAATPDGVAIDVGAYIGLHTVSMSLSFATVHAFEPQRPIFQVLCGNLALNNCGNVITHNQAVYDRETGMRLRLSQQQVPIPMRRGQIDYSHISNAASLSFEDVGDETAQVQATTIDALALDRVALIKIDAQGADFRVLRGAMETIGRSRPIILFEWERALAESYGTKLDDFKQFFADVNYEVIQLHEIVPGEQVDFLARPN